MGEKKMRMGKPFFRKDLEAGPVDILSRGRWANADLSQYRRGENVWVVKDFLPCPPLIRKTWGRFMVKREYNALKKLSGLQGVPGNPFLLDEYAVCYPYIPGTTLRKAAPERINESFFFRLEELVKKMHERKVVHLDIRHQSNILVTEEGDPVLLDFQSVLNLERIPRFMHRFLKNIDLSGVYKNWINVKPELFDDARREQLEALNRKRSLWFFKGYPLGTRKKRRL